MMSHLNHLNLQLHGKNHTVADMYEAVDAFRSKLNLLERDIHRRKLHFPCLHLHCEAENFKERFESSPTLSGNILLFLRQPFSISADGQWTAEAKMLLPSIDEAALQDGSLGDGNNVPLHVHESSFSEHPSIFVHLSILWYNNYNKNNTNNFICIALFILQMLQSLIKKNK